MELEGLPRGEPQRAVGVVVGDAVQRQPLRRRHEAAGQAHADHEAEGLLQLLLGALAAHVAVVLQIGAVELRELLVVLGDGAGHDLFEAVRDRAAKLMARFLDEFVPRPLVGHG